MSQSYNFHDLVELWRDCPILFTLLIGATRL